MEKTHNDFNRAFYFETIIYLQYSISFCPKVINYKYVKKLILKTYKKLCCLSLTSKKVTSYIEKLILLLFMRLSVITIHGVGTQIKPDSVICTRILYFKQ